jgi:hypothetical protein
MPAAYAFVDGAPGDRMSVTALFFFSSNNSIST